MDDDELQSPEMPIRPANHLIEGDPEVAAIELDPYADTEPLAGYETSRLQPLAIHKGSFTYRDDEKGIRIRLDITGILRSGGSLRLKCTVDVEPNVKFTAIDEDGRPILGFHNPTTRTLTLYPMPT